MLSGLCYPCWFVAPLFVLGSSKKEDPFLCFHAFQGLAFGLGSTVISSLVVFFVWLLFHVLPKSGGAGMGLLGVGVFAIIFVVATFLFSASIFIGWQASSGRFLKLPVLGEWAEQKMVDKLNLDYQAVKTATAPRAVAQATPPKELEPIAFPQNEIEPLRSGIDPSVAANYARQLLQHQPTPPTTPRPTAPAPPTPGRETYRFEQVSSSNRETRTIQQPPAVGRDERSTPATPPSPNRQAPVGKPPLPPPNRDIRTAKPTFPPPNRDTRTTPPAPPPPKSSLPSAFQRPARPGQ